MFQGDKDLRHLVISHLKKEEKSISALNRDLKRDGYRFHRLFLTGYLRALADTGHLREKAIPPAKVYESSSYRDKNLYETVGDKARERTKDEERAALLTAAVLQRLSIGRSSCGNSRRRASTTLWMLTASPQNGPPRSERR